MSCSKSLTEKNTCRFSCFRDVLFILFYYYYLCIYLHFLFRNHFFKLLGIEVERFVFTIALGVVTRSLNSSSASAPSRTQPNVFPPPIGTQLEHVARVKRPCKINGIKHQTTAEKDMKDLEMTEKLEENGAEVDLLVRISNILLYELYSRTTIWVTFSALFTNEHDMETKQGLKRSPYLDPNIIKQ